MRNVHQVVSLFALLSVLAGGAEAGSLRGRNVATLARHQTVAVFLGTHYHRCMGLTSLCPDDCGHSGTVASFRIVRYLGYEKLDEYGDPKCERFVFMLEDNKKNPKVAPGIRDTVNALKEGAGVLLSWNHDYVTVDGRSGPERPVVVLENLAPPGTQAWMEQVERAAGTRDEAGHGPTNGSDEWMLAVSRKLGVFDALGHGPDLRSEEWLCAVHRKAFGVEPEMKIEVVYRSSTGVELRATYDNLRNG